MEHVLEWRLGEKALPYFLPLFQEGVMIETRTGGNLKDFLTRSLSIPADYVETRIQTVFLNGKAVDDLKQAIVRDGSTVALSAAMPGLVGATLRRGGFFASLRPAITSAAEPEAASPKPGRVILKLFNLLVPELAPALLAEGVGLTEGQLKKFLEGLQGDFWENCRGAVWDGRPIEGPFSLPPFGPEKEDGIRIKVTWID
jgi:hypothetical protein